MDWSVLQPEVNWVEYHVYVESNKDIGGIRAEIMDFVASIAVNYIWQDESFDLKVKDQNHLFSRLQIGDCIEDEWFVLFLLLQCSTHFHTTYKPVISVIDNDGEFLLIEAALVLPKWLRKPKQAKNRVFLFNGDLHFLPVDFQLDDPSKIGEQLKGEKVNEEAARFIRNNHTTTKAEARIAQQAFTKAELYHSQLNQMKSKKIDSVQQQHFAAVSVPLPLAEFIQKHGNIYLAPALRELSLINRSNIPAKLLQAGKSKQSYLNPAGVGESNVWAKIRFSRYLFAQLSCKAFDEKTEAKWINPSASKEEQQGMILGKKLEIAFELLFVSAKKKLATSKKIGAQFLSDWTGEIKQTTNEIRSAMICRSRDKLGEDSDASWMDVSGEQLDELLQTQQNIDQLLKKRESNEQGEGINVSDESFITGLMGNINKFMNKKSGIDGISSDDSSSEEDSDFYDGSEDGEEDPETLAFMQQMDAEIRSEQNLGSAPTDAEISMNLLEQIINIQQDQPGAANALSNLLSFMKNSNKY